MPLTGKWVVAPVTDALIYRSDRVKPELARWADDRTLTPNPNPTPDQVRMEPGARAAYTLRVQEMRVATGQPGCSASRSCKYRPMSRLPPSVFHPTIVDSGTTFMYALNPSN